MEKYFKTIDGCVNFLKKNAQTGKERELNGVVMVGIGLYTYSDMATYAGITDTSKSNDIFYHFKNDRELIKMVKYLQRNDGYLCVC